MAGQFRSAPLVPRHRGAKLAFIAATIVVMSYVFLMDPQNSYLPHCHFHSLTGHSCPSCGLTRSLHALAHGDLEVAWGYHPLGPGIGFALVALNILLICEILLGRSLKLSIGRITKRALLLVAVGLGFCLWVGVWAAKLDREIRAARPDEGVAQHSLLTFR